MLIYAFSPFPLNVVFCILLTKTLKYSIFIPFTGSEFFFPTLCHTTYNTYKWTSIFFSVQPQLQGPWLQMCPWTTFTCGKKHHSHMTKWLYFIETTACTPFVLQTNSQKCFCGVLQFLERKFRITLITVTFTLAIIVGENKQPPTILVLIFYLFF